MHKFANEDVSLGSWFIGLEVEHIDDRNMCCQTPPGNVSKKDDLLFCLFAYVLVYNVGKGMSQQ